MGRTGREALLELLGLLGVLEHQGVQVLLAADLELDVADLLVLLDARGCCTVSPYSPGAPVSVYRFGRVNIQEASFRRQISMNYVVR